MNIPDYVLPYIHKYYDNGGQELRKMVDRILFSQRFRGLHHQVGGINDFQDFYSLANEVFMEIINTYDKDKDFGAYLYTSLSKAFIDEIKLRRRQKRMNYQKIIKDGITSYVHIPDFSLEEPLPHSEGCYIEDLVPDNINIEEEIIEKRREYSPKIEKYLQSLSIRQKKVAILIMRGCTTREIRQRLKITEREYLDCLNGLRAYSNIKILF